MNNNLEKKFEKVEKKKTKISTAFFKKNARWLATITGAALGLIVGFNIAIVLNKILIEDARQEQIDKLAEQRVKTVASSIEEYVATIRKQLNDIANKPTVSANLALQKQDEIDKLKKELLSSIDHAIAAEFIYAGKARLDDKAEPPIRFTELEMIRRAEAHELVQPEAAKIQEKWRLNFIASLPNDKNQDVIASLLLAIDINGLQQALTQNKVSLGSYRLMQKFGNNNPVTFINVGAGNAGAPVSSSVKGTYWIVEFEPAIAIFSEDGSALNKAYLMMLGLFIASVLVCLVIGRFVGVRIENILKQKSAEKASIDAIDSPATNKAGEVTNSPYQSSDVLDVNIEEDDEDLLGLGEVVNEAPSKKQKVVEQDPLDIRDDPKVPETIFRAYDIRGIAGDQITEELASKIGRALGSEAIDTGQETLIVACDARLSSPSLKEALVKGILASGCNVLDIGTVPTPLLYYATATLQESQSGVMVTASHNPGNYNGFKIVMNGKVRSDEDLQAIRRRIIKGDLYQGQGKVKEHKIVSSYVDTIFADVALAGDITIVIDAANGVTGDVAPRLFEELGCRVVPLFCELDGNFPNHAPDPSVEANLQALISKVKETKADIGVAFDGDGDRVIVVTPKGKIIWPDHLLMIFAKDIVSRNPGADVVFDVKSTRHLASCITNYGGRPIMWKTGHAPMKNKMLESGALLGGEYSGHIFIKDRWFGFDDGMYAAARLIEILSLQGQTLDEMFEEFPISPTTPEIRIPIDDDKKFDLIARVEKMADFGDAQITKIDGIRVDYAYGWGLVRASNTSPNLTLRFEADDEAGLSKIKTIFADELRKIEPTLKINLD